MQNRKSKGQVFTPHYLVSFMLNLCGYTGLDILKKHVIDNSCGDGAFLCEVVHRYIRAAFACHMSKEEIVFDLSYYIHGIEKDGNAYNDCLYNLSKISDRYQLGYIQWDVLEADALICNDFKGKMDYVVGNPPYVRVHNLKDTYSIVKHYAFTQEGMTDLYLAFFELGFSMLAPNGRMCYITPSSWLNSVAANYMREYLYKHRNMEALVDLGHFQPFERATAYTLISYFVNDKVRRNTFSYYVYDSESCDKSFVDELPYNASYIDKCFFLSDRPTLLTLQQIKSANVSKYVSVKNGFATLADNVFIGDNLPKSPLTIPIVKASTARKSFCIFPYDHQGKPLEKDFIFAFEPIKKHFEANMTSLLKGKDEYDGWYLYGRTQALADVYKRRLSINTLIRDHHDLKFVELMPGEGVYSGLYIIPLVDISLQHLQDILRTKAFTQYVKALKKYKSGGYFTFNSKDVEQYLNYMISIHPNDYVDQQKISYQNLRLFQELH